MNAPLPNLDPTPRPRTEIGPDDPLLEGFVRLRDFGAPAAGRLGYACRMGYLPAVKVRRKNGDRNGPVYVDRQSALRYLNRRHPDLAINFPIDRPFPRQQGFLNRIKAFLGYGS
jgi:hypothetical protein